MQCVTVQDTGHTVNKGSGLTDDLFRAAALAFTTILDPKLKDTFEAANAKGGIKAMGTMMTKGGSPGNNQSMIGNTTAGKALGILGGR
jgi:hypothetical protein